MHPSHKRILEHLALSPILAIVVYDLERGEAFFE